MTYTCTHCFPPNGLCGTVAVTATTTSGAAAQQSSIREKWQQMLTALGFPQPEQMPLLPLVYRYRLYMQAAQRNATRREPK